MQASLFDQGLILMLAGMGTVFVFLTVLVIAMTVMSMLIRRLRPVALDSTEEEVAAISVAIARHRQR